MAPRDTMAPRFNFKGLDQQMNIQATQENTKGFQTIKQWSRWRDELGQVFVVTDNAVYDPLGNGQTNLVLYRREGVSNSTLHAAAFDFFLMKFDLVTGA